MDRKMYADQVQLLVRVLPIVAMEREFALKGGTAINLFYRDLPRLSVDIDLAFLPVNERKIALEQIDDAMQRIVEAICDVPDLQANRTAGGGGGQTRLIARQGKTNIKIETSPVMRGVVFAPEDRRVSSKVEEQFGFAETQLVSFEDLYGSKIHAALDRQHPRDLFDTKGLYENEGLTDDVFRVFLVYIACSNRPSHELLNPNRLDLADAYHKEFSGMTAEAISIDELVAVRQRLVDDIQSRLTGDAAAFLRSLQNGAPDFDLIGLPEAAKLPAVLWKVRNLRVFQSKDSHRHKEQTEALERLLS